MDDVFKKIQMLLMKKNQEYGELRYLSSRTTDNNINDIEDLCNSVADIYLTSGISSKDTDLKMQSKCVKFFQYLMLNTSFEVQAYLEEDIINGHLVDMCPPLSPYLSIQISWKLGFEEILAEFLLHVPVDFCVQILEVTRNCIEQLEYKRATDIVLLLILNTYRKFILLRDAGSQSMNLTENVTGLVGHFQELIALLTNEKVIRVEEVSDLDKYERYGSLLKKIIRTIKECFEIGIKGFEVPTDVEKLYKITFGREPVRKCEEKVIAEIIPAVNQELMNLLLKKIKEIDCNIYLGWAEIDDKDNLAVSLQRSIGNDCYDLIEFLKSDVQLSQSEHLLECLQHLSSKPISEETSSIFTLQELCNGLNSGRNECIKELISRYKEWDRTILDHIKKHKSLVDKEDCSYLLEYLTSVFSQTDEDDYKERVYTVVTNVLSLQSVPDLYEILVEYITRHDGRNCLECPYTEENFNDFIVKNTNLKSPKTLKVTLLFLLKSPKKILQVLIKVTIGCTKYGNIMISPNDLLLFSPLMVIREKYDRTLLCNALKSVCLENEEWNGKKFTHLLQVLTDSSMLSADDAINYIFVPYLQDRALNVSNMICILNFVRKAQTKTRNVNIHDLILSFAKRMSTVRKSTDLSKYVISEMLTYMTRILDYFMQDASSRLNSDTRKAITDNLDSFLEPVNKLHFSRLWFLTQKGSDVFEVTQDYERRCFVVRNKLKKDPTIDEKLTARAEEFVLSREDFLRHLILRSTDSEYCRFGSEITVLHWFSFGWDNEIDAYDHFLRLTMEACCLCLEYPALGPHDSFAFFIKSCVRFSKTFARLDGAAKDTEGISRSLIKNLRLLEESIESSSYSSSFANLLEHLDGVKRNNFQELLEMLDRFGDQCAEIDRDLSAIPKTSEKVRTFWARNDFISACMEVPVTETYSLAEVTRHRSR